MKTDKPTKEISGEDQLAILENIISELKEEERLLKVQTRDMVKIIDKYLSQYQPGQQL